MSQADSTRKQQLEQLAQARALSREIAGAISAIENNDLRQLRNHIAAQEGICNVLVPGQKLLPAHVGPSSRSVHDPDAQLLAEVRQAHVELAQLNRVYGAVVKRAEKTVELLAAIYRAHGQGYDRKPSPLAKYHTWSCEV